MNVLNWPLQQRNIRTIRDYHEYKGANLDETGEVCNHQRRARVYMKTYMDLKFGLLYIDLDL